MPVVEENWLNSKITFTIAEEYLRQLRAKRIDTLILGCTHYPLLKTGIRKLMGKRVSLIDSAVSTAKAAEAFMLDEGLINNSRSKGGILRFFVSDDPRRFKKIGEKFLGRRINSVEKI